MDVNTFNVNVCSEQRERLIQFYADVVGLPPLPQVNACAFRVGGAAFLVDGHNEDGEGERAAARPAQLLGE